MQHGQTACICQCQCVFTNTPNLLAHSRTKLADSQKIDSKACAVSDVAPKRSIWLSTFR